MEKIENIKLTYCDLGIAYQCNFSCQMCRFWQNSPLNENNVLSIKQWKDVLEQINILEKSPEFLVNFSGPGESLLREHVFELIKYAKDLGLKVQTISNGFCIDEETAQRINKSGLDSICLSLDSIDYQVHDSLRGKKHAYEGVLRAINNLTVFAPEVNISINTVISGKNLDGLIELVRWAEDDQRIKYINFQALAQPFSFDEPVDEKWFMNEKYKFLWPQDKQKLEVVINALIDLKNDNFKIANKPGQLKTFLQYFLEPVCFIRDNTCNLAQAKILNIDPAGNVSKCQMVGIIDNVAVGKTLTHICASEKYSEHIDKINNCRRNCHLVVSCYYEKE